ncbi:MAG: hypothetical protein KTR26_12010 [Flammeovirgaceae bacterium]|nr:hypothetical protein [Flammeovirgaceae bacterium]
MNIRIFLLLLFFVAACRSERKSESGEKVYFDLAGFIDQQVAYLQENPVNATKKVDINGEYEEANIIDNKIEKSGELVNWEKELALFKEADINKPVLRNSYEVVEKLEGLATIYMAKEEDLPVHRLFVFRENGDEVTQITIAYLEEKNLFLNNRELKMKFEGEKLKKITINGFQKLPTIDSLSYYIQIDFR